MLQERRLVRVWREHRRKGAHTGGRRESIIGRGETGGG
jgi:hypothetical protein